MRAFGFDASRRALVAPLRGQIGSFTAGLVAFVGVMVIASVAFTRLLGDGGIVVALALAGMAGWWVGRRVGARRVVVERDGVRLVGALGERFVPRSEIVGVEVVRGLLSEEAIAHFGLDMVLRSGKRVRLDLLMQSKPQRDALRTMIEKGPSATKVTSTAPEASSGEYAA